MERVRDFLDINVKRMGSSVDLAIALSAFDAAHFWLIPALNLDEFGISAATFLSTAVFLKPLLSVFGEDRDMVGAKEPVFSDRSLGFKAQDLVFRGFKSLKLQGANLSKENIFLHLQLPSLSENATISDWVDVSEMALKGIKATMEGYPYKAVALEIPQNTPAYIKSLFKYTPAFSKQRLLEGKSLEFKKSAFDKLPVLSKTELEGIVLSPQQVFLKGISELADKSITDLLSLAKSLRIREQRDKVKKLIEDRLQQILQTQVQINFDGPELLAGKLRINRTSLVRRNNGNGFSVVEIYDNGEARQNSLDRILKTNPKDMNAALADQTSLRKAKIAYGIYQILQDVPFDELFTERILERDKLIEHFRKERITVAQTGLALAEVVDGKETIKRQMRVFPRRLVPIMMTLLAYAGAQFGSAALKDERLTTIAAYSVQFAAKLLTGNLGGHRSSSPSSDTTSSSELFSDSEPIGFPSKLPGNPDDPNEVEANASPWKVEANGMPASGYFTESTSYLIDKLVWKATYERFSDDKLELPLEIDESELNLKLSRIVLLKRDQLTILKIPIKSDTHLTALKVHSPDGKLISFYAYKLIDGTVKVIIPRADGFDQSKFAIIEAGFHQIDQDQPQVHATESVYTKNEGKALYISPDLLNPSLIRYYQTGSLYSKDGQQLMDYFLKRIRNSYLYSINPSQADLESIKNATSIEQMMNVIDKMDVCDCNTCNSLFVALASLNSYPDPKINLALGYLHNLENPASNKGNFLDSSKGHAYGIDETGKIYDATPSIVASGGLDLSESRAESDWNKMEQLVMKEVKSREEVVYNLRFLALILGLVPAYGVGWLSYKGARALTSAENIEKAKDKVILSTFSKEDLVEAHNFLGWTSWGNVGMNDSVPSSNGFHSDKGEILNALRGNLRRQRVSFYQKHPEVYPEPASVLERAKLRMLARFLT